MFAYCSSLTSIDLSNFTTSKVAYMHFMFCGCSRQIFINIIYFSSTPSDIYLFDQYIPSSGALIKNENFKNKLNRDYLSEWNIIIP